MNLSIKLNLQFCASSSILLKPQKQSVSCLKKYSSVATVGVQTGIWIDAAPSFAERIAYTLCFKTEESWAKIRTPWTPNSHKTLKQCHYKALRGNSTCSWLLLSHQSPAATPCIPRKTLAHLFLSHAHQKFSRGVAPTPVMYQRQKTKANSVLTFPLLRAEDHTDTYTNTLIVFSNLHKGLHTYLCWGICPWVP